MRQLFTAILWVACAGVAQAQGQSSYSNHRGVDSFSWWGSNQAENYDVAVRIDAPEFVGLDINSVTFHVAEDAEIKDFSIWASRSLSLENKVNAPDIFSYQVTPADGAISLSLDSPCRIGEDGIYLGYSFSVGAAESNVQKKPVAIIKNNDDLGYNFYLHTSKIYGKWIDNGEKSKSLIPFEITLSNLKGENVTVSLPGNIYAARGVEIPVEATMTNLGYEGVTSATFSYETPAATGSVTVDCTGLPEASFLESHPVAFSIPAIGELMAGDVKIAVTEVNGRPNASSAAAAVAIVEVYSRLPERNPLFEEYTGTGCGWCPRGAVGMDELKELYGDRFVGVAYHCNDIMSIFDEKDYPSPAPAQPVAWIDRVRETDPYLGDNSNSNAAFGADNVWQQMERRFTPADIKINCEWTDGSHSAIVAHADAGFVKSFSDADFRLIYILVEDGLSGDTSAWNQANYYSGVTGWPSEFDFLVNSGRYVEGYVYNDVAVYSTDSKGIEGSLPAEIEADNTYSHTFTINLSDAVNLSGESLVQSGGKFSVVAALIDATTGEILNCAEGNPDNSSVGYVGDEAEAEVDYFTLQGVKISNPQAGSIVIRVVTYPGGSKSVSKMIVR